MVDLAPVNNKKASLGPGRILQRELDILAHLIHQGLCSRAVLAKCSTPASDTSLDHKSVLEPAYGVMSSTQVDELSTKSMDCDMSMVREDFSFGSNRSSTEGHLNEAMDRSEACKSFENPD